MTTSLYTFANTNFRMRFQEPYVTEGLNAKLAVNMPPGVYRGFRLAPHASALFVTVQADPEANDHAAVYQTDTGYSLAIRLTGGDQSLDLTALASKTVVLAIFAEYVAAPATPTSAEILAYELSPTDEFTVAPELGELVILGQVVVPAAGVIPVANITPTYRTPAWRSRGAEAIPAIPLLRDPVFAGGPKNVSLGVGERTAHWERNGAALWQFQTTSPKYGYAHLTVRAPDAAVNAGTLSAFVGVPAISESVYYYRIWIQILVVPTAGTLALRLGFVNDDEMLSGYTAVSVTLLNTSSVIDADYRLVEGVVKAPADAIHLQDVAWVATGLQFAGAGDKVRIGFVQVYREEHVHGELGESAGLRDVFVRNVQFGDPSENGLWTDPRVIMRYEAGNQAVVLDRMDLSSVTQPQPSLVVPGGLSLGSGWLNALAEALSARITTAIETGSSTYTLVWHNNLETSALPHARMYITSTGSFVWTVNAYWDGTVWAKDAPAYVSTRMDMLATGLQGKTRVAGAGTWADGAWSTNDLLFTGRIEAQGDAILSGTNEYSDSNTFRYNAASDRIDIGADAIKFVAVSAFNPAATVAATNQLFAKNIVKAMARIRSNGTTTPTVVGGFNLAATAATVTGGNTILNVFFNTAFSGTDYSWSVDAWDHTNAVHLKAWVQGAIVAGWLAMKIVDLTAPAVALDLTVANWDVSVIAVGAQA